MLLGLYNGGVGSADASASSFVYSTKKSLNAFASSSSSYMSVLLVSIGEMWRFVVDKKC